METFISYFIKVNVVVSIFYFVYWLLLRNEKFFQLNRIFLLGTLIISLCLPFMPVTISPGVNAWQHHVTSLNPFNDLYGTQPGLPVRSNAENEETHNLSSSGLGFSVDGKEVFAILYGLTVLVLLFRFGIRLASLYFFIRKNSKGVVEDLRYCEHNRDMSPFSFFYYLVINRSCHSEEQFRQIWAHEKVHIRQWHTFDLLLAELIHIFLWLNPLMASLKRFIRLNLEYIADHKVLNSGFDKRNYQLNILYSCLNPATFPLTNLFTSSKLKLRIKMMNTKKSPVSHLYKYAIVLTIVFATYFGIQPLGVQPLQAHSNNSSAFSAMDLNVFEGYYSFQKDRNFVLQINSNGKGLILKELWTDNEILFTHSSGLEFLNSDKSFPLKFTKTRDGSITQLLAFNRDVWERMNDYNSEIKQEFTLTTKELKTFEGYYQFEKNPEAYLQFTVKENGLTAKQVWDGKEFFILPKSSLEFYSQKENYPAKFSKDDNSMVTQVLVFNQDIWKKVQHYTPRKEVKLSPQKLKAFEGRYTFQFEPGKNEFLQITAKDDHLILKEVWTGNEIKFVAASELEFFNKDRAFPLKFTKNSTGTVTKVLAFNRDLWTKVKE